MFKSDEGAKTRKKYQQRVDQISGLESKYERMDDEELKQQTQALRSRVAGGEKLESVLPEAFAVGVYKSDIQKICFTPTLGHRLVTYIMQSMSFNQATCLAAMNACP